MPTEYAEAFFIRHRPTLTPGFNFLAYLYVQPSNFGRIARSEDVYYTPIRQLTRALDTEPDPEPACRHTG